MADVIALADRQGSVDPDVVTRLEAIVESARRGEITSWAIAYTKPGRYVGEGWTSGEITLLIGAVSLLASRMTSVALQSSAADGIDEA